MDIALQMWGFVLFKTCTACLKLLVILAFFFYALENLRVKHKHHICLWAEQLRLSAKATTHFMQSSAEENRRNFFLWKSYLQILSNCCQLENLSAVQTKRDKAQAEGKGKTRHLRLSQRRLDEDPSTGTLDTPDASLGVCPELDLSERRANNSHWAQQTEPCSPEAALSIRN